jgi:carbamoyl-phosphate synthase large subunit
MDKYLLMKHCLSIGVPVPDFRKVNSLNSFRRAANELGYPGNEVCFKPRSSAGSRGFRILSAKKNRLNLLLKQEGGSVFTTLDEVAAILGRAKKFPELLVMKYLPKEEYSVDVLADKGRPIVVIPRIRKKIGMGASIVGETVKHKRIIRYTRKLISSLRLNGIVGLQFIADRDSISRLTEINPRPHGAVAFSIVSGANLLYFAIKLALGEQIKVPRVYWGAKVYRYFGEAYMLPHERSFRIL